MKHKLLIAAFVFAAAALLFVHLRLPYNTASWRMGSSGAAVRNGDKMAVAMPEGGIDVNRATADELDQLKGVGPALAQEIITEREQNGWFHYPEDLINVKGIGEKTLEKMLQQLKLP